MRESIAMIVPIRGLIISRGTMSIAPLPMLSLTGEVTQSDEMAKYIKELESNTRVKAIIFEIDSPGGTPYASKEIADAIKKS